MNKLLRLYFAIRIKTASGWRKDWQRSLRDFYFSEERVREDAGFLETAEQNPQMHRFPWSFLYAKMHFKICQILFGTSDEDWFLSRDLEIPLRIVNYDVDRRKLHFANRRMIDEKVRPFVRDKVRFARHWNAFMGRLWLDMENCSEEEFCKTFGSCDRIIVKDKAGYGGLGIYTMDITDPSELPSFYRKIVGENRTCIAEEYINQTGFMHQLNPSSLNTVRIITLRRNERIRVIHCFIRVGGKDAIVDNAHSKGLVFPVNLSDARICPGTTVKGGVFLTHPETGVPIAGQTLPHMEEMKAYCIKAHSIAPKGLELIGWDVCLMEDGMLLIEGNGYAGYASAATKERDNSWGAICDWLDAEFG